MLVTDDGDMWPSSRKTQQPHEREPRRNPQDTLLVDVCYFIPTFRRQGMNPLSMGCAVSVWALASDRHDGAYDPESR
jgi:hypothetical protein